MPVKPKIKTLTNSSVDIFNAIRNNAATVLIKLILALVYLNFFIFFVGESDTRRRK